MKVLVATDAHIYQTPDGKHWTPAIYGYSFWTRYLNEFDAVRIVARTKQVSAVDRHKMLAVDGEGVEVYPVPFFQGPKQLARKYCSIRRALNNVAEGCDVAIFRMPSQTAQLTYLQVKGKMPIAGEIVYDPWDDLVRTDVNPVIHIIDRLISHQLKRFCYNANGVSYVTENAIQSHYPSRARIMGESQNYFESSYSTITLGEDAFTAPRSYGNVKKLTVSFSDVAMNSERKGERIVLDAIAIARKNNYPIYGIMIGDGALKAEFERYALEKGIDQYIEFTGRLPSAEKVREKLLESDIFMFPSQAEGLPRGILEAMAIGLPVLSTRVGGIPEVIPDKYLFEPKDADEFANMLMHLWDNPTELTQMSEDNFRKSTEFDNRFLQKRRDEFYQKLKRVRI